MRRLFLVIMLCVSNCVAMDLMQVESPDNDYLVKKFFKAIKRNESLAVEEMITKHPNLTHAYSKDSSLSEIEDINGLHVAAFYGSDECMEILLKNGADPKVITVRSKNTSLHYVVTAKGAQLLLDAGAQVSQENVEGDDSFYTALFNNNQGTKKNEEGEAIADLLWKSGADIYQKDAINNNLLHKVVLYNRFHIIDFLLRNKVDVEARNFMGKTSLDIAVAEQDNNILQVFKKYGIFIFPEMKLYNLFHLPLALALKDTHNPYEYVVSIKNKYLDTFLNNWAPIFARTYNISLSSLNNLFLPHHGVVCNKYGCIIKDVSHEDLVQFFDSKELETIKNVLWQLCQKVLVESCESILFLESAGLESVCERIGMIKMLERFPFIITYDDNSTLTTLKKVIDYDDTGCLSVLLEYLSKNEISSSYGYHSYYGAVLYLAILKNNYRAIEILTQKCRMIDFLMCDEKGRTPMDYAKELDNFQCIKILNESIGIQFFRNFNQGNYKKSKQLLAQITDYNISMDGWSNNTLLHLMLESYINKQTNNFIKFLVGKGAKINVINTFQTTPLQDFITSHHKNFNYQQRIICETLLRLGARVNGSLFDRDYSLLYLALCRKDFKLAQLLLRYGAVVNKGMIEKAPSEDMKILLQEAYDKQQCFLCWDHPENLSNIPCVRTHPQFICKGCYDKIINNKCPMCRNNMDQFGL